MAEGAPLLRVYRGNSIEGSNPSFSAIYDNPLHFTWFGVQGVFLCRTRCGLFVAPSSVDESRKPCVLVATSTAHVSLICTSIVVRRAGFMGIINRSDSFVSDAVAAAELAKEVDDPLDAILGRKASSCIKTL